MSGEPLRVKFKVPWRNYIPGMVIEPGALLGEWLIRNGFAVPHNSVRNKGGRPKGSPNKKDLVNRNAVK